MENNSMQILLAKHGIGTGQIIDAAIIASGGGSTAEIYMAGARDGWIPGVNIKVLISTKEDAGCLVVAAIYGVPSVVVARKNYATIEEFNEEVYRILTQYGVELVYLAGCNNEIFSIRGKYITNNHPAPKDTDGGKGMHQVMAHEHVLERIQDEIKRYPHRISDVWRTRVDHHEAISRKPGEKGMDVGELLTTIWVDIPPPIIWQLIEKMITLRVAAERLQKHVMKYEYIQIISSAISDAERVRDAKLYGIKLGGF